ncbi:lipoyl(octanoyl) transferase LipB [Brevibacterium daeguense]|uniref:Octanoyltransferase n=2 Tax=Brevibacterium daeguense TaxID=909936 RepID=A0ABP8ENT2_9MICO
METSFAVEVLGLDPTLVDYRSAWRRQQQYHREIVADTRPSTLLVLEHSEVFTAGRRTEDFERPTGGVEVIDVDRGGRITWHGPGQLVVYLLYRLHDPKEVRLFVSQIEDAVIELCARRSLPANRVEGRSGVWLPAAGDRPERKISAVGIRIQDGVTMHGLSLNCSNSNSGFDSIVPCGIADAGVTSLTAELGTRITPGDVADELVELLRTHVTA